jgi:hypothetical protein
VVAGGVALVANTTLNGVPVGVVGALLSECTNVVAGIPGAGSKTPVELVPFAIMIGVVVTPGFLYY